MENASNALFIAAGVLIAVLVLSLGMYLFTTFSAQSREMAEQLSAQNLERFNVQFTSYIGKTGITIYDVISIANLATENNVYYELPHVATAAGNDNYITVRLINQNIFNNALPHSIEKGYTEQSSSQQNINYYNDLILKSLQNDVKRSTEDNDKMLIGEYDCSVEISNVTGRVYLVTFTRKNI